MSCQWARPLIDPQSLSRSRQRSHVITLDPIVIGDQDQVLRHGLSDQHLAEGLVAGYQVVGLLCASHGTIGDGLWAGPLFLPCRRCVALRRTKGFHGHHCFDDRLDGTAFELGPEVDADGRRSSDTG